MTSALTTFLFEVANFLVLACALGWLFFKPVRAALVERKVKFESDNLQAATKLAEAEKIQQEASMASGKLQNEMRELRQREVEAARSQAEQIVAEARAAAEKERELSRRQAAQLSDTQGDRLAEVCALASAESVGRLLTQIGGPNLHSALVAAACEQIRTLAPTELARVKVETTQSLTSEQIESLKSALGAAADTVDFRSVEGLGDGIRISTDKGLVDASVQGLVRFTRQSLVKEMNLRANNHSQIERSNHG